MAEYVKKHGLSLATVCACMVVGALLTMALGSLLPEARAQQVLPGGRAARIHSYYGGGGGQQWATLIEAAPGAHGFVITDISVSTGANGIGAAIRVDGEYVYSATLGANFAHGTVSEHFESGLAVPTGSTVECWADNLLYTISGYEF